MEKEKEIVLKENESLKKQIILNEKENISKKKIVDSHVSYVALSKIEKILFH